MTRRLRTLCVLPVVTLSLGVAAAVHTGAGAHGASTQRASGYCVGGDTPDPVPAGATVCTP